MKRTHKIIKEKNQLFTVFRIFICIVVAALTLFAYIEKQNELTELRLIIPALAKEVKDIEQINIRLTYEIEHFESPINLMKLKQKPEFSHLKNSFLNDEVFLPTEP